MAWEDLLTSDSRVYRNELLQELFPAPVDPRVCRLGKALIMQTEPVSLKEARRQWSAEVERDMILKELVANHWSIKKTAEHLKVSYRGLQYKIKEYGLNALK